MMWEISVLISKTWPRLTLAGTLISGRAIYNSSTQAAMVTITSAVADQNVPSLISAMAITVWVSARRKRVEIFALPARGPRWTEMTLGCGFFSLKTWMVLT